MNAEEHRTGNQTGVSFLVLPRINASPLCKLQQAEADDAY